MLNITADAEMQRHAYLHANFGTDVEIDDATDLESISDEQLEVILERARQEYRSFKPPISSVTCTYKHMTRKGRGQTFVKTK